MYICSQLRSLIALVYKTPMFTLLVTKHFKMNNYINGSCYCNHMTERQKCLLITKP
jgi:hypothetical protein